MRFGQCRWRQRSQAIGLDSSHCEQRGAEGHRVCLRGPAQRRSQRTLLHCQCGQAPRECLDQVSLSPFQTLFVSWLHTFSFSMIAKSFYGRLFGANSIHLSLSYIALHWLSANPGGVAYIFFDLDPSPQVKNISFQTCLSFLRTRSNS